MEEPPSEMAAEDRPSTAPVAPPPQLIPAPVPIAAMVRVPTRENTYASGTLSARTRSRSTQGRHEHAEADAIFREMDRDNAGIITPGKLLTQMAENAINVEREFASLFLKLDLNGDNLLSLDEWRAGFAPFVQRAGYRLKARTTGLPGARPLPERTPEAAEAAEAKAAKLIAPQVARLREAFRLFDRDGSGLLTACHFTAYKVALGGRGPEVTPLLESLDRGGRGGVTFDDFRAILARHDAAFADAGGSKGKKGKGGKGGKKGKKGK